jgi:hypothetical protein
MFVPFSSLPPQARIWIYQSDKKFTEPERHTISAYLKAFTEQWKVHGQPMEASFDIRYDQFVIIAANDQASGCSIDSSVRTMKEIGELVHADFFNRTLIAFEDGEDVTLLPLSGLKQESEKGNWHGASRTFNNLLNTKEELENKWIVPAGTTWLSRYLPHNSVVR